METTIWQLKEDRCEVWKCFQVKNFTRMPVQVNHLDHRGAIVLNIVE